MKPRVLPPDKTEWPLGPINAQLVVENPADPDEPPTTFSVTLQGENSEYLPGQEVSPGQYWPHGVSGPVTGWLENFGPSKLNVYIDGPPQAPGPSPADALTRDAASGPADGAG